MKNKLILIISMNVLLVTLAVLLSYRMIAPRYEAKQVTNLNSLGSLHTEAAAERVASFVSLLKDELKENVIRLIDPSRGPIFLDPSRWLWIRIQDKEWRAQGNLEALPLPRTDVDTWSMSQGKSSMVLSLRIPILKQGVQDFVLIEGGVKLTAFDDLQANGRFGLWVFDLNAYKKGGLSSAKIFEKESQTGSLSKEDVAVMTSEFLTKLFNSKESQVLATSLPWHVYFKKSTSNDQLGVLGFWAEETDPQTFNSNWIFLIVSLIFIAGLSSFLVYRVLGQESLSLSTEKADSKEENMVPVLPQVPPQRLVTQQQHPAAVIQLKSNPTPAPTVTTVKLSSTSAPPSAPPPPAPAPVKVQSKQEIQQFMRRLCTELGMGLEGKEAYTVDSLLLFMEEKEPTLENFDIEIAFNDFEKEEVFPKIESFFDQDIWRIHSNSKYLMALLALYSRFLAKNASQGEMVKLSSRHCFEDSVDAGCVELKRSIYFKEPFNRLTLYVPAKEVLNKKGISEKFELGSATPKIENVELPFSLDAVDRIHARLKMKSHPEEGHVIYFDIPAAEPRRPEDIVFVKQLKGLIPNIPLPTEPSSVVEDVKVELKAPVPEKEETPPKKEEVVAAKEKSEEEVKALRLSEIERVSSFAEGISDERTRARSRFRIKRPGEK
jgi:hypothetical protein